MVNVNGRVLVLFPGAVMVRDFMVAQTPAGEVISYWNPTLGTQPTEAQLAAVPQQQAIDAEAAYYRSLQEQQLHQVGNVWIVRLGSNVTDTTGAFQNAVGLHWPVRPNTNYVYEFTGFYNTALASTGLHLSVNGPAGPNSLRGAGVIYTSKTALFADVLLAYDTPIAAPGSLGTTVLPFTLRGNLAVGNTGGNFGLRFRSGAAGSQVQIFSGSHGVLSVVLP